MADSIRFKVDGRRIKEARKTGVHCQALRVIRPDNPEERSWGATISGELRVFRKCKEADFEIEAWGDVTLGCPTPDARETKNLKHVYIQQSRRQKYLNALVARCDGTSWYAHDIKIIGSCEIVYDRYGRGFRDDAQLWIQTRGRVINLVGTWEKHFLLKRKVDPVAVLESVAPA